MKQISRAIACAALGALTGACTTSVLAPGAEQVRVTRNPADVAGCAVAGNVWYRGTSNDISGNSEIGVKNLTLGIGGNVLFVTQENPYTGVAYRCGLPPLPPPPPPPPPAPGK